PEGDDGWPESRLTLESFLQGCTGKVTVLAGQPGSGKTLLMSFIGQQWTKGLKRIRATVLLELRQLNLLSDPLSLSELLFHHYLPTNGDNEEQQAVVDYLLSNPEQSCWVLDGYDEFQKKLKRHRVQNERLDSEKPRPVAELISGLLSRRLLAGSTVLVTSRVRDVVDLDGLSDKVGQLLPWDHREIKECVNNFFSGKDGNHAANAAEILFSSRHLLAMSSLPALCNICCVFLQHSLHRHAEKTKVPGEKAVGVNKFVFVSLCSAKFAWKTVSLPAAELCELSRVAWRGLEESRIIFLDEDVPLQTLQSSVKSGLFSQMEVRGRGGGVVNAYCFLHLTVQEFLAALRIMTSSDVSDADLKKKFSLKTRWTTKSDQKTVFTDSLYLYVCGLASSDCTPALEVVAKATGLKAAQNWVQKRQALVLKLLEALCRSASLTGPKILQLCHCVQESQNQQLAQQVVRVRPTLELRNFWLLPSDIEALAFVVNSVGTKGVGLDFGACSMELECLDSLSRCQYIHYLSFRSRKYGDKFAEKLSSVLPRFIALRKLEFCGASLSSAGAASLASGLQNCPSVTELNFSDNNLQDEGIRHIADVLAKLQNLASVKLGRNNTSLEAAECLVKHVSSCSNIQQVHADGIKELTLTFSQKSESNRLLNQKWTKSGMQNLARSLARCPSLSELELEKCNLRRFDSKELVSAKIGSGFLKSVILSGGEWDEETLKMLTQFVPNFSITDRIILNDSCSSVQSVVILTALLSDCLSVMEMNIRFNFRTIYIYYYPHAEHACSVRLFLSCCNLQPIDLERVWRSLGASSDLSDLDLSCNKLGDKGLKKLLDFLPRLSKIQRVENEVSSLLQSDLLCFLEKFRIDLWVVQNKFTPKSNNVLLKNSNRLTHVYISTRTPNVQSAEAQFCNHLKEQITRFFRINRRSLTASDVNKVCRKLVQCRTSLELEFTQCSFAEKSIENLLRVLPKMSTLQRLNVSNSIQSTCDALTLISCFPENHRVSSVELRYCFNMSPRRQWMKEQEGYICKRFIFCIMQKNSGKGLNQILQQSRQLSYLDLSGNQLEDEGVRCLLKSLPNIRVSSFINLSKNGLSQQGALHVATALCTCTNVSAVEVSLGEDERCLIWFKTSEKSVNTTNVRDSRLQCDHLLRLANIVSDCLSLTKVELKNNMLQSEWIENFVTALNVNLTGCTISVEERWIGDDEAASLLRRCLQLHKPVQTVRIDGTTLQLVLTDNMDRYRLRRNPSTSHTSALCPFDTHKTFTEKSRPKTCQRLKIVSNSSVEGARLLCSLLPSLPNLSSLSFTSSFHCYFSFLTLHFADFYLHKCLKLPLQFGSTYPTDTVLLLPRLRSFNSVFVFLLLCSSSHCVWSAAGRLQFIETLKDSAALEELCLDAAMQLNENCCRSLAQTLRNMRSLQILKLGGWRMGDGGIQKLTGILPGWKDLRTISLSKNLVSDPSGEKLLEALSGCRHLEELHISENSVGNEGLLSLSRAIMSLKNLRKIQNLISAALKEALIVCFYCSLTSVRNSELSAVAASLSHCPFIQDVGFGWNNCGDDVALELAKVLPVCHDLTRIDLECNSVSAAGVEALVRALRCCPALQVIRLWKNEVSLIEAQRFSQMERRLNFSST
uniref:NACHT domain-containing protein n=1 Tax=Poecilia formosa TaxID=48698 RepID=A0A087XKY5_POEFO